MLKCGPQQDGSYKHAVVVQIGHLCNENINSAKIHYPVLR